MQKFLTNWASEAIFMLFIVAWVWKNFYHSQLSRTHFHFLSPLLCRLLIINYLPSVNIVIQPLHHTRLSSSHPHIKIHFLTFYWTNIDILLRNNENCIFHIHFTKRQIAWAGKTHQLTCKISLLKWTSFWRWRGKINHCTIIYFTLEYTQVLHYKNKWVE